SRRDGHGLVGLRLLKQSRPSFRFLGFFFRRLPGLNPASRPKRPNSRFLSFPEVAPGSPLVAYKRILNTPPRPFCAAGRQAIVELLPPMMAEGSARLPD